MESRTEFFWVGYGRKGGGVEGVDEQMPRLHHIRIIGQRYYGRGTTGSDRGLSLLGKIARNYSKSSENHWPEVR